MNSSNDIKNQKGCWLFVVPVSGLILTPSVNQEITIDQITFVSGSRLPRVRKRLGFPETIGNLRKKFSFDFFDKKSTFAVANLGGIGTDKEQDFLKLARQELAILSLSQLGYSRRRINACLCISDEKRPGRLSYLMMNITRGSWSLRNKISGRFMDLVLDDRWKHFQRQFFFNSLLNILNGKIEVSSQWRCDIRNAAVLAGKSQSSTEIADAFLWNMIAIEALLTHQGDSYSKKLPKRVEAFIGWTTDWALDDYENKIRDVYKKRCALVHAGQFDAIGIDDLLFTDILLVNVFTNIMKHISYFRNKEELIKFATKVEAEHVLGIKPVVRPKTLSFTKPIYSDRDYEEV